MTLTPSVISSISLIFFSSLALCFNCSFSLVKISICERGFCILNASKLLITMKKGLLSWLYSYKATKDLVLSPSTDNLEERVLFILKEFMAWRSHDLLINNLNTYVIRKESIDRTIDLYFFFGVII